MEIVFNPFTGNLDYSGTGGTLTGSYLPLTGGTLTGDLTLDSSGVSTLTIKGHHATGAAGGTQVIRGSRGNSGTPLANNDGDTVADVYFGGTNSSGNFVYTAAVESTIPEVATATVRGDLSFYTNWHGGFGLRLAMNENGLTVPGIITDGTYGGSVSDLAYANVVFIIDGGGSAISTGVKGYLDVPFDCIIRKCTLLADQSGSIQVDIMRDTYANFPPTTADTIVSSSIPYISASTCYQDTTLSGWNITSSAGSIYGYNVTTCSTITKCTVALGVTKI